jgi:putative ABC transport system substrate-binding protein
MKPLFTVLLAALLCASASAHAQQKRIAVTMIVEVPQLLDVKRGLVEELARLGYREGQNLAVDYSHAAGSFPTQQQIARKIVGDKPDVIVPITTPSAITVVQADKDSAIPVVFSVVTDPLRAKVVPVVKHPGGFVTGVSDLAPVDLHIKLMKEMVPGAKRLGVLMNPSLPNTQTYLEMLKQQAPAAGLTIVESAAPQTTNVQAAALNLVGKADMIYIPNDTTVYAALEAAVKVAMENKVPLFCGETRSVERGCAASISFDYYDVGAATAQMVKKVLDGTKPGDLDVNFLKDTYGSKFQLWLNAKTGAEMGLKVTDELRRRATKVF